MDQVSPRSDSPWTQLARSWTWPAILIAVALDGVLHLGGALCPRQSSLFEFWSWSADVLEAPITATLLVMSAVHALSLATPGELSRSERRVSALLLAAAAVASAVAWFAAPATLAAQAGAVIAAGLLLPAAAPALRPLLSLCALLALWQALESSGIQLTAPGLTQDLLQGACLLALGVWSLRAGTKLLWWLAVSVGILIAVLSWLLPQGATGIVTGLSLSAHTVPAAVPVALAGFAGFAALLSVRRADPLLNTQQQCGWDGALLLILQLGSGSALALTLRSLALMPLPRAAVQSNGFAGGSVPPSGAPSDALPSADPSSSC